MKVFLSSVISGFEIHRDAADDAVSSLGHTTVRAEQFGARTDTPQQACLRELRGSDLVVLMVADRYGAIQPGSGLSATHEEFREARDTKPLLVFVQSGMQRDEQQAAFLTEVQNWAAGRLTESFTSPDDLRRAVLKGLHDYELRKRGPAVDAEEMTARSRAAVENLPPDGQSGTLIVAVTAGPSQQVVASAEFDSPNTAERVFDAAVTGRTFTKLGGAEPRRNKGVLTLSQHGASLSTNQSADVTVVARAAFDGERHAISALVEEDIANKIVAALLTAAAILDGFDGTGKVTHVAIQVGLRGAGWMPWRTASEYAESGGNGVMGAGGDFVAVSPPQEVMVRQALRHEARQIAVELTARLRREVRRDR